MKNARGFTLIELMITIAILAIIVGIAVPAYQNQVEKTRRADAVAGLTQAAHQMERCFTRTNSYADASCTSAVPASSPDGFYTIQETDDAATKYTLEATGVGPQSDDDCSPFTLDHLGNKGDDGDANDRCWGSN